MFDSRLFLLAVIACVLTVLGVARAAAPGAPAEAPKPRLVIVKAVYGDLPDGDKTDVTTKVAGMVKDDRLSVVANNDNFDDPAEGVVKKLKVDYTIDGKAGSKTVNEDETLAVNGKPSKIVIVKAVYGDLPDGDKTDVTAKVAEKVDGDTLSVKAGNDLFGDPAEGISKSLKVTYTFDGKEKSKTVAEDETLTISETGD
jgi:hypothetical protein